MAETVVGVAGFGEKRLGFKVSKRKKKIKGRRKERLPLLVLTKQRQSSRWRAAEKSQGRLEKNSLVWEKF